MKKLYRLLMVSISIFTIFSLLLVVKTVIDRPEYLQNLSQSGQELESHFDINDVLQKVTNSINSLTGSDSATLKADLKTADGTGSLVEDSVQESQKATSSSSDLYTFPEDKYPYRAMLTAEQKNVYDQIYANAAKVISTFKVTGSLPKDQLESVMTAVYDDHPELFWLDTSYSFGYSSKGYVVSVTLKFNSTADNISASKNRFNEIANNIIAKTSGLGSDLEKEKYIYKYLMNIVTYDEDSSLNQSAYSAMVNGSSVCAGYSRAFQYLMMQVDIPCYFSSGYANNNYHAWNIVKIDGVFRNVDLSWDDSIGEASATYSYQYFNISDKVFSQDHKRLDMSLKLPVCY